MDTTFFLYQTGGKWDVQNH